MYLTTKDLIPISRMTAHSAIAGGIGFAAGFCAHSLVKSALTRVALGALGAAIMGGGTAAQYVARAWCDWKKTSLRPTVYAQAKAVETYYVTMCVACVALGILNIPQAAITLSLLSLYPLSLALLAYRNRENNAPVWNKLDGIEYLPESLSDFVIGREVLELFKTLCSGGSESDSSNSGSETEV